MAYGKLIFSKKYQGGSFTRNNAMRFAIDFAVDHHQVNHADWLQEYYVEPNNFTVFIDYLREIVRTNNINLLNATIRYVQADSQSILTYAKKPSFCIVLYFDQDLSPSQIKQTKQWTQELISKAQELGGNYYLPYQQFATKEQFRTGYPGYTRLLHLKQQYDPTNLFSNNFYENYFK